QRAVDRWQTDAHRAARGHETGRERSKRRRRWRANLNREGGGPCMNVPSLIVRCPHCGISLRAQPSSGNELMTCPAEDCRRPFRVEVPSAETVASLNVPPSAQEPATLAPQLSQSGQALGGAAERQTIHLKMFRRYSSRCLAYLLAVVAPASAGVLL